MEHRTPTPFATISHKSKALLMGKYACKHSILIPTARQKITINGMRFLPNPT